MKTFAVFLILFGSLFAISRGILRIYVSYEYTNEIGCNWDLSERASTIAQKSEYMTKFMKALEAAKLDGVNSNLIMETPESDFTQNMKALKSLQQRLIDISGMDENSFAYQTALQQITAQEQGEAHDMLDNLKECWKRQSHYTIWNELIGIGFLILQFICIVIGCVILSEE